MSPFVISILACSWPLLPSFVSLHLSPFVISILACSWLPLPSFVSLHLSPCMISILACSWLLLPSCVSLHSPDSWKLWGFLLLNDWVADPRNHRPLTPCLPNLSPFVIRLLGFSWLQLPPCQATLCSWLQPPCIPSLSSFSLSSLPLPPCFPSLSSSFLLGGCWQLSPCFPVLSGFSPFMILYLWFLYLFMCSYVKLALYACYWFMSSSMVPFYSQFFAICVG